MRRPLALSLLCLWACRDSSPPLSGLSPAPLAPLLPTAEAPVAKSAPMDRVEPADAWGAPLPAGATRIVLHGESVEVGARRFAVSLAPDRSALLAALAGRPALLDVDRDTYLAQAAPLLTALDEARVETWLAHPSGRVAYRLTLRDATAFDAWLRDPQPGKIRIVQRQDGFELSTNMGKLPGADPNAPTVPARGGQLDIALLRGGLERLLARFRTAKDVCLVPSFATELQAMARALSATYRGADTPMFESLCLVYPRPR